MSKQVAEIDKFYIDLPDKEAFEISDNSQHNSHTSNNLKLNFDFLKEIANGDKSFMRDFLQTYVHEIEMAINDMNNYELSAESVEYKKVLHKIKPSLEMVGLLSLRTQVEHFEKQHLITSEDIKQINDTILPPMQNSLTIIEKILSRKEIEL